MNKLIWIAYPHDMRPILSRQVLETYFRSRHTQEVHGIDEPSREYTSADLQPPFPLAGVSPLSSLLATIPIQPAKPKRPTTDKVMGMFLMLECAKEGTWKRSDDIHFQLRSKGKAAPVLFPGASPAAIARAGFLYRAIGSVIRSRDVEHGVHPMVGHPGTDACFNLIQ